jgi:hypothetical protein
MNAKLNENFNLEFTLDIDADSRLELLKDAATRFDNLENHLGSKKPKTHRTPEAALLEDLTEDVAEFAGYPVVHRITERDFPRSKVQVPATFRQLSRNYRFYWLYFPLNLVPKRDWRYDCVQLMIEFNPDSADPHLRPKAYQILPDQRFQDLLRANTHLELCLDENFEFSIATGALEAQFDSAQAKTAAGVDVRAAGGIGLVAGPFIYSIRRATITHSPPGVEKIAWRLDGPEFFQENTPAIIVIAQVPNETREVRIAAAMRVTRGFSWFDASLSSLISHLPDTIRGFFEKGMPLCSKASWDITPSI